MSSPLPSYSIIIETENLSLAASHCLIDCLASIRDRIRELEKAPEKVYLINSGDVSFAMARKIALEYDFIEVLEAPAGSNYYESKMFGLHSTESDIVVFADSDCRYEGGWLAGLVTPFTDPDVSVVAGETGFGGQGAHVLAMKIIHSFDGYSGADDIYPVNNYYANNFAIRRQLLLDVPIPTWLPLYRHACSWHCVELRRRGEVIWGQPRSRAVHAPPEGFSHFFWRFLLFGRDRTVRARLGLVDDAPRGGEPPPGGVAGVAFRRLRRVLRDDPRQALLLPIAGCIVVAAAALIKAGQLLAMVKPDLAIDRLGRIEGVRYPTVEEFLHRSELAIPGRD
jgi:hypothetical protein